jgi:2-amino-4-hydroxy-6-hydroxymethyldihydropteridine diphosphokinase
MGEREGPRTGAATVAYVALGSNLGDRAAHLCLALRELDATPGVRVRAVSAVSETAPVGGPPQGAYLNAVARVETSGTARALLDRCLEIEARAGRVRRGGRAEPRTLDLDLLLFGSERLDEPGLVVPHPRLHERAFVLAPLCELAPELRHPVLGARMADLLAGARAEEESA